MRLSRNWFVLLLATILTLLVFLTTPITERNQGLDSDGVIYARIAALPAFAQVRDIPPPYCQRILTPKLVSLLPGRLLDRFRAVAFVATAASLLVLFNVLALLGFAAPHCYLGTLLYAGVFWTAKFSCYSPAYIDHVTQLFLLLILHAAISRHYYAAIALLGISAFQKESLPMFSVFVAAELFFQTPKRPPWRTAVLVGATLVLPFLVVRFSHSLSCASTQRIIPVLMREAGRFAVPEFLPVFAHATFSGLGLLPVVLLVQHRPWLRFLQGRPSFVAYLLVAGAALMGGAAKSRLFSYALPVMVILALETIRSLQPATPSRAVPWIVVLLCGHWYLGNYLTPIGTFDVYLAKLVPEHAKSMGGLNHMPFLLRDCAIALLVFLATVRLTLGEWHYRPAIGFTRRDIIPAGLSRGSKSQR